MAKPYSDDFRRKVMQAIAMDGLEKARQANCSTSVATPLACGVRAKLQPETSNRNQDKLYKRAAKSPTGRSLRLLCVPITIRRKRNWLNFGGGVSQRTISRASQKVNHTRKKTYGCKQRDEAQRSACRSEIGDLKAAHLVYVDESGMDERDD